MIYISWNLPVLSLQFTDFRWIYRVVQPSSITSCLIIKHFHHPKKKPLAICLPPHLQPRAAMNFLSVYNFETTLHASHSAHNLPGETEAGFVIFPESASRGQEWPLTGQDQRRQWPRLWCWERSDPRGSWTGWMTFRLPWVLHCLESVNP